MKLIVNREALIEAVNFACEVVPTRTPSPAATCVKLIVKDGKLEVLATDYAQAVRWFVGAVDVKDPGELLIPAKKLAQVITAMSDDTLSLESEGDGVIVKGATSRFVIMGHPVAKFPDIDKYAPPEHEVKMTSAKLARIIDQVYAVATVEASRFATNGICFDLKNGKMCVATADHPRVHIVRDDLQGADGRWLLPRPAAGTLRSILATTEGEVRMYATATAFFAACFSEETKELRAVFRTTMLEDTFPSYEGIIPKELDKKAVIKRESLATAVRQAMMMTNEETKGVRLSFNGKNLVVTSRAPQLGDAAIDVMCEYTGEPMDIGMNPKYLADALAPIEAEQVTIQMKSPNKPMQITGDPGAMAIIMPVNLS
jgi:DNA polymerase-3 subunit beta